VIPALRQPTDRTCGQTVVAMITGEDVGEIVRRVGDRATTAAELRLMLAARGRLTGHRLINGRGYVDARVPSVLRVLWEPGVLGPLARARAHRGHWCAWCPERRAVVDPDPLDGDLWTSSRLYRQDILVGRVTSWFPAGPWRSPS
jgi:hypothetical protein